MNMSAAVLERPKNKQVVFTTKPDDENFKAYESHILTMSQQK